MFRACPMYVFRVKLLNGLLQEKFSRAKRVSEVLMKIPTSMAYKINKKIKKTRLELAVEDLFYPATLCFVITSRWTYVYFFAITSQDWHIVETFFIFTWTIKYISATSYANNFPTDYSQFSMARTNAFCRCVQQCFAKFIICKQFQIYIYIAGKYIYLYYIVNENEYMLYWCKWL